MNGALEPREAALRNVALACIEALAVIGPGDPFHRGLSSAADGLALYLGMPSPPRSRRPPLTVIPGGRA